jgi:multidrug resistance efflux pump
MPAGLPGLGAAAVRAPDRGADRCLEHVTALAVVDGVVVGETARTGMAVANGAKVLTLALSTG